MENRKTELETVAKASRLIAAVDVVISAVCAANGNAYFACFMVLAGLMWAYGVYIQLKADGAEGE